jgi:UTP-glucose-1-phosphate uridylyltransferase
MSGEFIFLGLAGLLLAATATVVLAMLANRVRYLEREILPRISEQLSDMRRSVMNLEIAQRSDITTYGIQQRKVERLEAELENLANVSGFVRNTEKPQPRAIWAPRTFKEKQ